MQLYNLVLYDVFKMMITKLFLFMMITKLFYTYLEKFLPKNLRSKSCKQKLRHQVVDSEAVEAEALRVEAEAIKKLPLPHP